ncbi:E3 ubiquitin-protein ligase MARCH11 [Chanos chanos]|uniref:RING-type E3 ubiquitin transferase n=1 Tax=Chanos chanos TaxID=29144 RepID=A0A6J2VA78_CHACN|nr:E3 ubiquitin-protein ligase MARCH11-like [Chanos chanos]
MNTEGEAGPFSTQTEHDPPGGATLTAKLTYKQNTSDEDSQQSKTSEVAGVTSDRAEDRSLTEADSEDSDDEKKCISTRKQRSDKSHKSQTVDSQCSSEGCIPTPSCRICFQGAEQGELLSPCRCDGSVRHAHQQCLLKWISERGSWTCELCNYRFHIVAMTIKRPCQWQAVTMSLVEKVQMVAVVLGAVFLLASVSWLLWSALSPEALWQRRDVLFQFCYAMYGLMDVVCIGLIVHEGGAVYNVFLRWRAVNLLWDVQNYDKNCDVEETNTSDPATHTPPRTFWLPHTHSLSLTHTTRLEPSPLCPLHAFSSCLCSSSDPPAQEPASGEVVLRVTSV